MEIKDWLELPIYLQVTLGGGYLAYAIAYNGKRKEERSWDVILGTVLMSLPGLVIWLWLESWAVPAWGAIVIVLMAALVVGVAWRLWGRTAWMLAMLHGCVSNSDDRTDVWARITQDLSIYTTQLKVTLQSGTVYMCQDVSLFEDAPISMYSTDIEGNVVMYVTHIAAVNGDFEAVDGVQSASWGDLITYIPAAEIKLVEFRHKRA